MYCDKEKRFTVLPDDGVLDDPSDLYLFAVTAHEYGHHLQNLTGMALAFDELGHRNKSELYEQTRRNELQAECPGGVFIGSVWKSLSRTAKDWKKPRALYDQDDDEDGARTHGKSRNVVAWLEKGFTSSSPASCNTWTAPSATVA